MVRRTKKGDVARLRILQAIHVYGETNKRSASFKDLMGSTGIKSSSTVKRHVDVLRDIGCIQNQNHGEPRSLVLTESGVKAVQNGFL